MRSSAGLSGWTGSGRCNKDVSDAASEDVTEERRLDSAEKEESEGNEGMGREATACAGSHDAQKGGNERFMWCDSILVRCPTHTPRARRTKNVFTLFPGTRKRLFGMGCKARCAAHSSAIGKHRNAADGPKRH